MTRLWPDLGLLSGLLTALALVARPAVRTTATQSRHRVSREPPMFVSLFT